jgi:hypothetical protein
MAARLAAAADTVGAADRVPLILGGHDRKPAVVEEAGTLIVKPGARARTAAVVDIAWPAGAALASEPLLAAQLHSCEEYGGSAELDKVIERHLHILQEVQRAHLLDLPPACRPLSSAGVLRRQTTAGTLLATCLRDAMGCDASVIDAAALLDGQEYPPDAERFTYGDLLRLVDGPLPHPSCCSHGSIADLSPLLSFPAFQDWHAFVVGMP